MLEEITLTVTLITVIKILIQTQMPRIGLDASKMTMAHILMYLIVPHILIGTRIEMGIIVILIQAIEIIRIDILIGIVATIVIDIFVQSRRL